MNKKRKRTVDEIPILLYPFYLIYGWIGGLLFLMHLRIHRLFAKVTFVGKEYINTHPAHILSFWHENIPLYFIANNRFRPSAIWLTYPFWHMKPIHVMKKWVGIEELAYGASGIDGKKAMDKVILRLKEGWYTGINPDGPKGPLKKIKKGVLLMSALSGVPVIPVKFKVSYEFRIPSWDRKRYPCFGAKLTVEYGKPVFVTIQSMERDALRISEAMNDISQR